LFASSNYPADIDNQAALNYTYDAIGNLTGDAQAGITNIVWSVYGKILSITKNGSTTTYTYDEAGNRITKTTGGITTSYVRDAKGNVLSVYIQGNSSINSGALTQTEINLFGSSRLGVYNSVVNCTGINIVAPAQTVFTRGTKLFELSNHLGNVMVTVSDKKLQHTSDNNTVDYYTADVASASDYYPGGMPMPRRQYSVATGYRYGFNGKEKDCDMDGNNYDYGFRIYNPQIGKFLSTDPLQKKYPELTPYQFASNTPIQAIDLDGKEALIRNTGPIFYEPTIIKIQRWFR